MTMPYDDDDQLFVISRPADAPVCCHHTHDDEPEGRGSFVKFAHDVLAFTTVMSIGALSAIGLATLLILMVFHGNPLA